MVDIPQQEGLTPEQAWQRLQEWFAKKRELAIVKQSEHLERVALSKFYFPTTDEGTARFDLGVVNGVGYDLVLVATYNRNVDEAALDNVKAADAKRLKLNLDTLFPTKPSLSVSEYRKLTDAQRKFVDALLDIKPGSPQMDIKPRPADAAPVVAMQVAEQISNSAITIVDDLDAAAAGDYYEDGEGQWWHFKPADEPDGEPEWAQCDDPRGTVIKEPAKPARKRKGAA